MKDNQAGRWWYDEFRQVGKDYGDPAEADVYDASHAEFRDVEAENNAIIEAVGLRPEHVVLELGTGTGAFAVQAAARCAKVYAADVSTSMLAKAQNRAQRAGVSNVEFVHAGFLTYQHAGAPVDAIVTSLALHHLPDFWKGIALQRLHALLKPGGTLYLMDVILNDAHPVDDINAFIAHQAEVGGDFLREDAEGHFREEYSTYDWVMDGLLERAGFSITTKKPNGILVEYVCSR